MIEAKLAAQLDALLEQGRADPTAVPGGMLAWWGPTDFPDGTPEAPALSQPEWENWYHLLQTASLVPGAVTPLYAVKAQTKSMRPDGTLPIAIASYRMATFRPQFAEDLDQAAEARSALSGKWAKAKLGSVIEERRAFMVAGLLHEQFGLRQPVLRSRLVTFVLDRRFYFTNPGDPLPDEVQLDPGDGGGFRSLQLGDSFACVYPSFDEALVTVRCRYGDTTLQARMKLKLGSQPTAPFPDETWTLRGSMTATGTAYVYRAHGNARVTRPVIVAEGFPGGYPYTYLYDMMNQAGTLESLRAAGRDVILLGFDNGVDLIQNNALVAVACIRRALQTAAAPLAVGGVSMGGLVARYALTYMESRGLPHGAETFFTIDTPHRGAYTNLSAQWFAHHFKAAMPQAGLLSAVLDSPANQQFMMHWVHEGQPQVSPLRRAFIEELESLGSYPRQLKQRLAVACGRGDGQRNPRIPPGKLALSWDHSPWASACLWALPEGGCAPQTVARGYSFLSVSRQQEEMQVTSDHCWESAPGGQNLYNALAAAMADGLGYGAVQHPFDGACVVPTVSALDLDHNLYRSPFDPVPPPASHASPFHDYICSEENTPHLTLTPKVGAWLLGKLGARTATRTR